jgi:asparagine synthase (glutamine-hydrolysing)
MCGICGILQFNDESVSLPLIRKMADVIRHRGPDDDGYYVDGQVALGHRRLAIIDLSPAGHQPMCNETGDVIIVYNGELFNYQLLRVELQAHGHRFFSQSDTEVIVHAYEEWGERCVERFNGQFAFAIWDAKQKTLFLARDRFGVKPLYYYVDRQRFLFASEIKAIRAIPSVKRGVSLPALNEYFTFQNVLSDLTLFEGVFLLPAGHHLTLSPQNPSPRPVRYWDYPIGTEQLKISEEEAIEEVYRLFVQAVSRQLMSDVPVASYLSGGMDSGSICAVAGRQLGRLLTFTCGFDLSSASGLELNFDERKNAEVLANLLKTEHYETVLHAGDMEYIMPELIWHLEDLRVGQCYPNYYVARLAGKFVKVVLSGGGGDEIFGGYPWRYFRGLNSQTADEYYRSYYDFWQRLVPDTDKSAFFVADALKGLDVNSTFDTFRSVMSPAQIPLKTREDYVNTSLYFELKTFLNGLLIVEDKISMAHSLETRVPFLDNDLVDFAMRLPARFKIRNMDHTDTVDEDEPAKRIRFQLQNDDGKLILRQAMSRIIPQDIATRSKQGFSAPDASWFRGESIDYINRLLRDPRARIFEYLAPDYVTSRLDEHTSGRHNNRLFIWSLLSFEWWLRKFM